MELAVRGERLRAAEEAAPAGLGQHRHPPQGVLQHRQELRLHVAGQFVEAEPLGDAVHAPGSGPLLEGADQQAAGVLAVVGTAVVVAQHRQFRGQVELLGMGVVVLAGRQRHLDPGQPAQFASPHAGAVDHHPGADLAPVGEHARDPSVPLADAGHPDVLETQSAARAGPLEQGHGDIDRAGLAVLRHPGPAQQVTGLQQRIQRPDLLRGDLFHPGDAEGRVHRGDPLQFLPAVPGMGDGQAADLAQAGGLAGLPLQVPQQVQRIPGQAGMGFDRAHGADQAGRMPGRAAGELTSFQQQHLAPAPADQVVGDAGTDHATADDHGARPFRQFGHDGSS